MTDNMQQVIEPIESCDLDYVKTKAARLVAIEDKIEDLESEIELLKVEQQRIRIKELPEAMFQLEIDNVPIGNKRVHIEPLISATLPKKDTERRRALDWLVDNKLGGGIKRQIEMDLPKGDEITTHKIIDAINAIDKNLKPELTETIHHKTYTALCTRLVQNGAIDLPIETLGIFIGSIARVSDK